MEAFEDDLQVQSDTMDRRESFAREEEEAAGALVEEWSPRSEDAFKVVVRVRPPLPRELRGTALQGYQCTTLVEGQGRIITLSENLAAASGMVADPGLMYATYRFTFDHVYDQQSSQEEVYSGSAQQVVLSILQGYNAALIAYGQTGTGKTYTMEGDLQGPERGIIPRTVEDIFTHIVNDPEPSSKYLVRASYLQIYNEVISDLLKPDRTNLIIREDRRRGVFVEGLSEWVVRSPSEVYQLMEMGQSMRATGATKLNEVSSRSHAVCIIIVEKCTTVGPVDGGAAGGVWPHRNAVVPQPPTAHSVKVGKLSLVDLAGSERVHVTGAVGKRLEESKKINASLSALGNVIAALTARGGERTHIPYRDSKLTRILEDSLGGNCKTTMICTVAPSLEAFQESLSTLKFANRAKTIKNEAHVNEDLDQRTLLRKYERELRKLRAELQKRSKSLVDKRALMEAEEQTRRAEADKLAVLTALEKRSRELMKEKEEKLALEAKISAMQSQLLVGGVALPVPGARSTSMGSGGSAVAAAAAAAGLQLGAAAGGGGAAASLEDVPAFKQLLQREQRRIRSEYEARLRELEGERQAVEEDRQQVDRYKQLLLKQRDIMIALTARLNERDEQIMALQEELEACDRHQRQLEDALDNRTAELYALRKAAAEAASSPLQAGSALSNALSKWAQDGGTGAGAAPPGGAVVVPVSIPTTTSGAANARASGHGALAPPPPPGGESKQPQALSSSMDGLSLSGTAAAAAGGSHAVEVEQPHSSHTHHGGKHGHGHHHHHVHGGHQHTNSASSSEGLLSSSQAAAMLQGLQAENNDLRSQLAAMHASAAHATLVNSNSGDMVGAGGDAAATAELVEVLTSACETAQRERTALQQILDTKVKRMMTELVQEAASQQHDSATPRASSRLLAKLQAMETVLSKVSAAIAAAPPIITQDGLLAAHALGGGAVAPGDASA